MENQGMEAPKTPQSVLAAAEAKRSEFLAQMAQEGKKERTLPNEQIAWLTDQEYLQEVEDFKDRAGN